MLDDFSKLKARTQQLGNHHRKYIHFISAKKDLLIERLEESGTIDEVHFWSAAPDQAAEMEALLRLGKDEKEKLAFLGCYFAFQILNLNLHAVDVLRLGLSTREDRLRVYRDFMLQMGRDLRRLSAAYMEKLLDLFLPAAERPNFVICSVGTRADQDDLDVGIVDDGSERRETFNRAIGFMQREMLRRAIPLHFHLSEHVGEKGFAASIDEYVRLLSRGIQDFIIISEMLGASPIFGCDALYSRFTREVTDRYFFDRFADNRFHEGYLRGIMGEVRSLLLRKLSSDSINPKRDALRIIKGLISALKTVHGIDELNAWHILDELRTKDPAHGEIYDELEDALSFVEAFRFLYQILEVEEEEILLAEEGSRAQLEAVAELMGYRDLGVVRAYDHLLIHYHEHVQATRAAAKVLLADLKQHLERISVFSGIIRNRGEIAAEGKNLSLEFVRALRFFRGTRYWDDVMTPMETDLALLRHFVDDFNNLFVEDRKVWIQRYAKWGEVTSLAVIRLLVILYQKRRKVDSLRFFHDFSAAFIDRVSRCPDVIPRLTAVFEHYPRLINDFLVGLREDDKLRFAKIFEGQVWSEEVDALRQSLRYFCRLHCSSSHYFKRFFQRIVTRYAEYVAYFNHTERLQVISKGIFARIESLQTFEQKKEGLGDYYDLEFLRVGLECIEGASSEKTNAEFTEFSDNYLQTLFDICKQEVDMVATERVRTRDLFALYSAGGHGRKLAFDDDYDLIILLNSTDPAIRKHCNKIITRMNREIVRRGTMPHYRFAERFGDYVTTFDEIIDLFNDPDDQTFIDMSQLMGARKLVGSKKFKADLYSTIIRPLILDRKDQFISQVAGEMRSRHAAVESGAISEMDVKETKGGLRDIELLLLILMASADICHPVSHELHEPLAKALPEKEEELDRLFETFRYLKRRRDIYRLTVAAEDEMLVDELGYMAVVLGYSDDSSSDQGSEMLVDEFLATTGGVARIVDSFLDEMGL